MNEDLTAFLNTDEFATNAVWKGAVPVRVIFDNEYIEQYGAAGRSPIALGIEADFEGVKRGDSLIIGSVTYTIESIEPDGTGMIGFGLLRS